MHQLQSLSQLRLTSSTRGEKDDLFSPRHFCQDALTTREGCARDASYAKRTPREPGRPRHTPVATLHDRRPLTAGACRRRSPAPAPPHRQPAPAPPWPSDDVVPLHPVALAPGRSGCDNGTTSDMTDGRPQGGATRWQKNEGPARGSRAPRGRGPRATCLLVVAASVRAAPRPTARPGPARRVRPARHALLAEAGAARAAASEAPWARRTPPGTVRPTPTTGARAPVCRATPAAREKCVAPGQTAGARCAPATVAAARRASRARCSARRTPASSCGARSTARPASARAARRAAAGRRADFARSATWGPPGRRFRSSRSSPSWRCSWW
jgi:ABC-2 type transport system ATP-binding protein